MGSCRKANCDCRRFKSHFSCSCGYKWEDHSTIFESARDRRKSGRDVENICGANPIYAAAAGAVTNFSSLVPGAERMKYDPRSIRYKEVQSVGGRKIPIAITDSA